MEDWSNMHQNVLDLILSKLFGKDQHTFSLVCPSWHKALLASPHRQSPCLMYNQNSLIRFFQHDNCFGKRFINVLQNWVIRFSNHGWLLMTSRDNNTIFFFDPFNNRTITLPNVPRLSYTTISFFHPPTSTKCFIVGIASALMVGTHGARDLIDIGVLRQGEGKWKNYTYHTKKFSVSLAPPVLNRGLVYFVDVKGNVATFDINQHGTHATFDIHQHGTHATFDINQPCYRRTWRVNSRCIRQRRFRRNIKELFLIKPKGEDTIFAVFGMMREERDVGVFRLVESNNNMHWEAVDKLGERVFYVSYTSSNGYSTSAKNMANKIFFPKLHGDKFVFYSLDTEKYHSGEGSYSSKDSHGLKRLDFATWTMPIRPLDSADNLSWCPQVDDETTNSVSSSFRSLLLR